MAKAKLSSKLPDDDTQMNGLDEVAKQLVANPHQQHVVIMLVDSAATTVDHRRGDARIPTAGITHLEVVQIPRDLGLARQILDRAFARRTGQATPKLFDVDRDGNPTDYWMDSSDAIEQLAAAARAGARASGEPDAG